MRAGAGGAHARDRLPCPACNEERATSVDSRKKTRVRVVVGWACSGACEHKGHEERGTREMCVLRGACVVCVIARPFACLRCTRARMESRSEHHYTCHVRFSRTCSASACGPLRGLLSHVNFTDATGPQTSCRFVNLLHTCDSRGRTLTSRASSESDGQRGEGVGVLAGEAPRSAMEFEAGLDGSRDGRERAAGHPCPHQSTRRRVVEHQKAQKHAAVDVRRRLCGRRQGGSAVLWW